MLAVPAPNRQIGQQAEEEDSITIHGFCCRLRGPFHREWYERPCCCLGVVNEQTVIPDRRYYINLMESHLQTALAKRNQIQYFSKISKMIPPRVQTRQSK